MRFKLNKPFAPNSPVDEFDVRQVKRALNRLGYYMPDEMIGMNDTPDRAVFEALEDFQRDNDLPIVRRILPGDENEDVIVRKLGEVRKGKYIWRTMRDAKVRKEHRALDGEIRDWSDDPDPGEEDNCRCWAVPIPKKTPNCDEEKKFLEEARREFQNLEKRWSELGKEYKKLQDERNQIMRDIIKVLGIDLGTLLLTLPVQNLDNLVEFLRRVLGLKIQEPLLSQLDKLGKRLGGIWREMRSKRDQVQAVRVQLPEAYRAFEEAVVRFEDCKEKISVG